jgi:hypothetical protein
MDGVKSDKAYNPEYFGKPFKIWASGHIYNGNTTWHINAKWKQLVHSIIIT